jgi:hypothetical protein
MMSLSERSIFAYTRNPIYVAFALVLPVLRYVTASLRPKRNARPALAQRDASGRVTYQLPH